MLRSLLGFDWRKSKAHLLLLSKFLHGETAQAFAKADYWKEALGETPQRAIERLGREGVLVTAGLSEQLAYKYKVTELRDMLKQRGIPVSGRKDDLISRLVEADPGGMKKAVAGLTLLKCSERGREIASLYLASKENEREATERKVLEALQNGKFREASLLISSYEAAQVFSRGLGIDWKNYDSGRDVAMLTLIFRSKPKILARLDQRKLEPLRLAAGMKHLWGTGKAGAWLPADFETGLAMDNESAARMFMFFAAHQRDMKQYRELSKAGREYVVEIDTTDDQYRCEACRKLAGKSFRLNEVPELPYAECTSEMGCRCMALAKRL